jgi:hypothetical protein
VITLALVPDNPGAMPISVEQLTRMQEWAQTYRRQDYAFGFLFDNFGNPANVGTGVRRIRLSSRNNAYIDCHADGTGVAVTPWWNESPGWGDGTVLTVARLLWDTVSGLAALGRHATQNCGAYGEAVAELRVVGTAMKLHARGPHGANPAGHGHEVSGPLISRHTVSLDAITGSTTNLLLTARILLTEIMQAFGLPEVREITADGALRIQHFFDRRDVEPLAGRHGVEVVEEFLNC